MPDTLFQTSFAAGELSPGLLARVDFAKYRVGASLALNQYVDVRGGLSNRPGTSFVGRSKQTQTGNSSAPVTALKGVITFWVNPVGMRTDDLATLCAGNQVVYTSTVGAGIDSPQPPTLVMGLQNQGQGSDGREHIYPDLLNVFFQINGVNDASGNNIDFYIAIGDFFHPTTTYLAMPANGFALAFQWDFSGNDWAAAITMGTSDGAVARVDTFTHVIVKPPSGPQTNLSVNPAPVGAPMYSATNLFNGPDRAIYFNLGADEGTEGAFPPTSPYPTDMWDPAEFSQYAAYPGAATDMTNPTNFALWYDPAHSNAPVNIGSDGSTPTSVAAFNYYDGAHTSFFSDHGTAADSMTEYSVTTRDAVTPTASASASTIPAAGAYQAVGIRFGQNNGAGAPLSQAGGGSVLSPDACGAVSPRLIPFQFSTIQAYVLEFGDLYMRVIMNGGYVLETAKNITGVTQANPGVVTSAAHGFLAGDWVFITGVGGMTELNGKSFIVGTVTTNTFQLLTLDSVPLNTTAYTAYTTGGTAARYFTLVTPYSVVDVLNLKYAQSADVLTITHPLYPAADITRTGNASWTYTPITFAPNINPPTLAPVVTASSSGSSTYRYVVTAVSFATAEESRGGPIGSATGICMSQTVGASYRLTWLPVAGAAYYNLYRQPEVINGASDYGQIYGFVGTTTGVSFTDQNISPDFSRSPPQPRNPFLNSTIQYWRVNGGGGGSGYTTGPATVTDAGGGTGWIGFIEATGGVVTAIITQYGGQNFVTPVITAPGGTGLMATATIGPATGNYPGCVSYFQQRKCFAASANFPETFWMSQIGNFNNMDVSVPARDSDAITGTIASTQVNAIKFLLPMASGLIMGSSSGAWQVSGGSLGAPVTPSNIVASPQAFNGSSDVQPIPVNYDILFVQNKSNVVRDLTYNFYINNYNGADVSVLANHLFYGFQITEWAYQDEPTKIIWAIRNDGTLLSFTFLKEQEVFAWTHHETQGTWVSVVTIPEGEEDSVYLAAQRTIPGVNNGNPVFYIERMQSRQMARPWTLYEPDAKNAWFLDCALSYSYQTPAACALIGPTIVTTDEPVFGYLSIGSWLNGGGGIFEIGTVSSNTQVIGSWTVLPAEFGVVLPEGDWTLTVPVTTVTGLDHLEGASVMVLSNGSVEGPYTVVNGSVTLQVPSDVVVVGLQYIAQGTTMYVDLAGGGPSVAGKRKTNTGVTAYLENSRGLSLSGSGFDDTLVALKERTNEQMGQPTRLQTGELRTEIYTDWTVQGQIYWQSEWPLPFTLLGLAGEFTFGDQQSGGGGGRR